MDVGSADAFDQMGTLGIEEEFYIVNEQAQPTAGIQELVYENPPGGILEDRVDHELFQCTIEAQTPTTPDVSAAESALTAVREELVAHAADFGFRIAAAGLHPLAQWRQLAHATKPRYQSQLNRIHNTGILPPECIFMWELMTQTRQLGLQTNFDGISHHC